MRRAFDIAAASLLLLLTSPLLVVAAVGVKLASPGPVLYPAARAGRDGVPFRMLKFRTMTTGAGGAAITARNDARVYPFGALLRRLKIDELPQLLNVLRGEMSMVGPRPEDPRIVAEAYTPWMMETLRVRPGITGPGSVFYYACGEALVDPDDPEGSYIRDLLPPKLAIERAYMERATVASDIACLWNTARAIAALAAGRMPRLPAEDIRRARAWAPESAFPAP